MLIEQKPKYTWGGATDPREGLDCSGYLSLAAHRAGLPVRRTTAGRMALGDGGWIGLDVPSESATDLDLAFWTFQERRPDGHVGAFYGGSLRVTHASYRKGVEVEPLADYLKRTLSRVRRLTIGE
jgi:cell wall-associated NlpC family hydrolase